MVLVPIPGPVLLTEVEISTSLDARIAGIADGLAIAAARRLGNREDADDAVQETLARLWTRIRTVGMPPADEIAPIAWGIARHVIADMLRERERQLVTPDRLADPRPDALEAIVSAEATAAVRSAVAGLAPEDRELLVRCFMNGERIVDIAAALGEPPERLRKRKSRAMGRLAAALARQSGHASHETPSGPMEEA